MKQGLIGHVVVLVLSMGIVAAACGDDDKAATSTTLQMPSATTVVTTTTTTSPTAVPQEATNLSVAFSVGDGSDCSQVGSFERQVVSADDAIRAAFDLLVAGPTDSEQAAGASSSFSAATTGTVRSVTVQDGLLVVDFEDLRTLIPNASTSCGSEALLAQLNATAFQFPEVLSVRYEIAGNCDAFANWLQHECREFERTN